MATHVSLGFIKLKDSDLVDFAQGVIDGLTDNADFPTPPVIATALNTKRNTFSSALAKANKGSVADTIAKNAARTDLEDALRQDAVYVEQISAGDEAKITSTGYDPMTHAHNPVATMTKAEIKRIENAASGSLLVRVNPIPNAHSYEVQTQTAGGAWQSSNTSSQARGIVLPNLTPGTTYNVRVRAVGAGGSYGDWSDPVGHICT